MLAGVGCGCYAGLDEAAVMRKSAATFVPAMAKEMREGRLTQWRNLLANELTRKA